MTDDGGPDALSFAFTAIVQGRHEIWTMGLHVLGLRDVVMKRTDVEAGFDLVDMIRYLAGSERPVDDGHVIADLDGPRFRVAAQASPAEFAKSPMHNPFGRWKLVSLRDIAEANSSGEGHCRDRAVSGLRRVPRRAARVQTRSRGVSPMRYVPALFGLLLAGCGSADPAVSTFDEVAGPDGADRLVLRFVAVPTDGETHVEAFDFHSVAWEVRDGDAWAARLVITADEFQRGAGDRRSVSALHSLDPARGLAVLQVGQEQPPDARGRVSVQYSWREWDLVNNREVRVIRVCQTPFEGVDGMLRRPGLAPP
jgi:hypothetical protein